MPVQDDDAPVTETERIALDEPLRDDDGPASAAGLADVGPPLGTFSDLGDLFEFSGPLDYYDGPLAGMAKRNVDGQWFAFECRPIIFELAWHWVLVPTSADADFRAVIEAAARDGIPAWLSVIEDRRPRSTETAACSMVRIVGRAPPLPSWAKARRDG